MADSTRGFVYHVIDSDPARVVSAMASARNAINALGEDVRVDILAQANCVTAATKTSAQAADLVAALKDLPHVQIWLCSLAAQGNAITEDDLLEGAFLATTATAHAVQRQFEGWAYVRG